jgi:hypothetical protein
MKFRKLALWFGIGVMLVVLYSNFMASAMKAEAEKTVNNPVTQSL